MTTPGVPSDVKASLAAARSLNESIRQKGIAFEGAHEAVRALQWQQTALLSEAVLTALVFYVKHGRGSRGARAAREIARRRPALGRLRTSSSFRSASRIAPNRFRNRKIHLRDAPDALPRPRR